MSAQLFSAMNSILSMEYYKNENQRSGNVDFGHEAAVALKLDASGFSNYKEFPKISKKILNEWIENNNDQELRKVLENMPNGSYILQPLGSQSFPDILVKDINDRFVAIECKSTSGYCPMWNDNLPKPNTIYVLSSGKLNETTIFMAKDVISDVLLESQKKMLLEMKDIVKKYDDIHKTMDSFNRGWIVKFREQHFQMGGNIKSNYFTHVSRTLCEQNALEFAGQ